MIHRGGRSHMRDVTWDETSHVKHQKVSHIWVTWLIQLFTLFAATDSSHWDEPWAIVYCNSSHMSHVKHQKVSRITYTCETNKWVMWNTFVLTWLISVRWAMSNTKKWVMGHTCATQMSHGTCMCDTNESWDMHVRHKWVMGHTCATQTSESCDIQVRFDMAYLCKMSHVKNKKESQRDLHVRPDTFACVTVLPRPCGIAHFMRDMIY